MKNNPVDSVILLSGGIDSSTLLYWALNKGYKPHCLIVDYNQRHSIELKSAKRIVKKTGVPFSVIKLDFLKVGSALLDKSIKVPKGLNSNNKIPITYVPSRNIIFLSIAASYAETLRVCNIFIGANIVDYSGYPDCRPEFLRSMERTLNKGTKAGSEGLNFKIKAPLVKMSKVDIIKLGLRLGVPYDLTWSCYEGSCVPCNVCDSCRIRAAAFNEIKKEKKNVKSKSL